MAVTSQEHRTAAETGSWPPGPGVINRIAKVAMAVVVAIEVLEEARYLSRHARRKANGWWAGVEHRELRQLRSGELGYLLKRFPSR